MSEKLITIWIGKFCCITNSEFPDEFPKGVVKADDFPKFNPFRSQVPIMGNIPKDIPCYDLPQSEFRTGKTTKHNVRLIFTDLYGNKNLKLASQVGGLIEKTNEITNLTLEKNMWFNAYKKLAESTGINNHEDFVDKELVKRMGLIKEVKAKMYNPYDFLKTPGGGKK